MASELNLRVINSDYHFKLAPGACTKSVTDILEYTLCITAQNHVFDSTEYYSHHGFRDRQVIFGHQPGLEAAA